MKTLLKTTPLLALGIIFSFGFVSQATGLKRGNTLSRAHQKTIALVLGNLESQFETGGAQPMAPENEYCDSHRQIAGGPEQLYDAKVRGEDTRQPGFHSTQALILLQKQKDPNGPTYPTTGTVISSEYVLLSGHGVVDPKTQKFRYLKPDGSPILEHSKILVPGCEKSRGGVEYEISEVIPMRNSEGDVTRDAALVRLSRPVCNDSVIANLPINAGEEVSSGIHFRHYGFYPPKTVKGDVLRTSLGSDNFQIDIPPLESFFGKGSIGQIYLKKNLDYEEQKMILTEVDTESGGSGGPYVSQVRAQDLSTGSISEVDVLIGYHLGGRADQRWNFGRHFSGEVVDWIEQTVGSDNLKKVEILSPIEGSEAL